MPSGEKKLTKKKNCAGHLKWPYKLKKKKKKGIKASEKHA